MIELAPAEYDDVAFLSLAQRIVNGAVTALKAREVYLVQTDNWFDWKWLGFGSRWERGGELTRLCAPPFNPNRIRSEKHFIWDASGLRWTSAGLKKPLHIHQPARSWSPRPLDRWSKSAAFVWYSGNSTTNQAGSLMVYLSGEEAYAWYASFKKHEHWQVNGERKIARRELESFEKCGRRLELIQ
jgi:hypothetical protein